MRVDIIRIAESMVTAIAVFGSLSTWVVLVQCAGCC